MANAMNYDVADKISKLGSDCPEGAGQGRAVTWLSKKQTAPFRALFNELVVFLGSQDAAAKYTGFASNPDRLKKQLLSRISAPTARKIYDAHQKLKPQIERTIMF